jgi:hypothetical protein|tara:strand:- start:3612 stop:3971 length:360 start_codon:yes stop_codon:yes gene_type:complete
MRKKKYTNHSRQQKGRYLQNILKEKIMALYPSLTNKDIRTSTVGENGSDIKLLSLTAKKLFRYSAECKNRNENKLLYSHFKHAKKHSHRQPLLVIKTDREKPLAVITLEHFFELLERDD